MSKLLDNVVGELSRLPGIGRRTALRLAMHILRMDTEDVVSMGESLIDFRTKICRCAKCNNLSDTEICEVCADASRDRSTVCVVEQVSDLLSIEKTHQYRGVYSVLGGVGFAHRFTARPHRYGRGQGGYHRYLGIGRGRNYDVLSDELPQTLPSLEGYNHCPRYRLWR